jgi:hypothetical protein
MTTINTLIQSAYREGNLLGAGVSPTASELTEAVAEYNSLITNLLELLRSTNLYDIQLTSASGVAAGLTLSKHTRVIQQNVSGTLTFPAAPDDGSRISIVPGPNSQSATFSGTGSGTNLTTTAVTGTIRVGDKITGTGVPASTYIVSQTSGATGGAGVYVTSNATTSAADALTAVGVLTLSGNNYTIGGSATQTEVAPLAAGVSWFFRSDVGDWRVIKAPFVGADETLFAPAFDDLTQALIFQRLAPRYNKTMQASTQAVIDRGMAALIMRYFQGARLDIALTNLRGAPQA